MDSLRTKQLEEEQRWVQGLQGDISVMAQAVAEQVVDNLEREVAKETETGFMQDIAEDFQRSLLWDVSSAFEEAIDQQLLGEIREQSSLLDELLQEGWSFDSDRQAQDSLRKSVRLLPQVKPHVDRIFQKARPKVVTQIFRAIAHDVEDMEKEWQADGEALSQAFTRERSDLERTVTKIAENLLQQLRLNYRQALDQAERRIRGVIGSNSIPKGAA